MKPALAVARSLGDLDFKVPKKARHTADHPTLALSPWKNPETLIVPLCRPTSSSSGTLGLYKTPSLSHSLTLSTSPRLCYPRLTLTV